MIVMFKWYRHFSILNVLSRLINTLIRSKFDSCKTHLKLVEINDVEILATFSGVFFAIYKLAAQILQSW